ncbi:glycosyltransferase family 4 protein [Gluconobacter morbifer]|uniref:Glycosyltransferase n=1 Tax=Gluconobacter morbifer G707 TaxID=1088869 RepID=G6XFB6_9PROT|nr:glycosyltransferase family 1 protein [Gluconobacter morbifer]EHH68874.1 hypothetical protein GMO_01810 [Gluconobacter morbifer G707]
MRIGLDTRTVSRTDGTGVATYASVLAESCQMAGDTPVWLQDDALPGTHAHRPLEKAARFLRSIAPARTVRLRDGHYLVKDVYRTATVRSRTFHRFTRLRSASSPDLMHWTYPLPLTWEGIPNVVTIHDLIPLLHPEFGAFSTTEMRRLLQECCSRATAIVTVSNAVRKDLVATLQIPPERITVLSQAVSFPPTLLQRARSAPAPCPADGYLYFGSLERRKNIGRIIEAHGRSRSLRPLTLIGTPGFGAAEEMSALHTHPAPERVRIVSWCPRPALIRTIMEAHAIVFPSLAEGFGLPIIEAMTLGTPVITSQGHATEEIAGDAALLVPPMDTDALTNAFSRLDGDKALRMKLIKAGLRRADKFTQSDYARRLKSFYRTVLETC